MVITGFCYIKEIPHITVGYIGKTVKLCKVILYIFLVCNPACCTVDNSNNLCTGNVVITTE